MKSKKKINNNNKTKKICGGAQSGENPIISKTLLVHSNKAEEWRNETPNKNKISMELKNNKVSNSIKGRPLSEWKRTGLAGKLNAAHLSAMKLFYNNNNNDPDENLLENILNTVNNIGQIDIKTDIINFIEEINKFINIIKDYNKSILSNILTVFLYILSFSSNYSILLSLIDLFIKTELRNEFHMMNNQSMEQQGGANIKSLRRQKSTIVYSKNKAWLRGFKKIKESFNSLGKIEICLFVLIIICIFLIKSTPALITFSSILLLDLIYKIKNIFSNSIPPQTIIEKQKGPDGKEFSVVYHINPNCPDLNPRKTTKVNKSVCRKDWAIGSAEDWNNYKEEIQFLGTNIDLQAGVFIANLKNYIYTSPKMTIYGGMDIADTNVSLLSGVGDCSVHVLCSLGIIDPATTGINLSREKKRNTKEITQ